MATHRMFFVLGAKEQRLGMDATRILQQTLGSIKEVKVIGAGGPLETDFYHASEDPVTREEMARNAQRLTPFGHRNRIHRHSPGHGFLHF